MQKSRVSQCQRQRRPFEDEVDAWGWEQDGSRDMQGVGVVEEETVGQMKERASAQQKLGETRLVV